MPKTESKFNSYPERKGNTISKKKEEEEENK